MKLSNEQIQAILDGAPEGATHVNYFKIDPIYLKMCGVRWNQYNGEEWLDAEEEELRHYLDFRNLTDLREILTLRQEVERLKAHQAEVAARAIAEACNQSCSVIAIVEQEGAVNSREGVYCDIWLSSSDLMRYANQLRKGEGDEQVE